MDALVLEGRSYMFGRTISATMHGVVKTALPLRLGHSGDLQADIRAGPKAIKVTSKASIGSGLSDNPYSELALQQRLSAAQHGEDVQVRVPQRRKGSAPLHAGSSGTRRQWCRRTWMILLLSDMSSMQGI